MTGLETMYDRVRDEAARAARRRRPKSRRDQAGIGWFAERSDQTHGGCVRIVETWKWDAHHLELRLDSGDVLTVGGLLLVDRGALIGMVADKMDAELRLPKHVGSGRELVTYLLSLRRTASQRQGARGPSVASDGFCGLGIAELLRTHYTLFLDSLTFARTTARGVLHAVLLRMRRVLFSE